MVISILRMLRSGAFSKPWKKQLNAEFRLVSEIFIILWSACIFQAIAHLCTSAFVICQSQQQGFKMVPSVETFNGRGKPNTNVGSGTLLQCGPRSFYLISQGGLKGTSKPVKHIVFLNENEEPIQSQCGLSIESLINLTFQMCWKYPTATKAVRELPPIKYAKRLGNQVLSSINTLEQGCQWFGNNIKLVCPEEDSGTEEEKRSYIEWVRVLLLHLRTQFFLFIGSHTQFALFGLAKCPGYKIEVL